MEDLTPCPFCGGTEFEVSENIFEPHLICENCSAMVRFLKADTPEKLEELWNTRV